VTTNGTGGVVWREDAGHESGLTTTHRSTMSPATRRSTPSTGRRLRWPGGCTWLW